MTTPPVTPPTSEERIAHIEGEFVQISSRLSTMESDIRESRSEVNARLDLVNRRVDELRSELNTRLDSVNQRVDELRSEMTGKIDDLRSEMTGKIDDLRSEMNTRLDQLNRRIDRLYYIQLALIGTIAVATVAAVISRFFGS